MRAGSGRSAKIIYIFVQTVMVSPEGEVKWWDGEVPPMSNTETGQEVEMNSAAIGDVSRRTVLQDVDHETNRRNFMKNSGLIFGTGLFGSSGIWGSETEDLRLQNDDLWIYLDGDDMDGLPQAWNSASLSSKSDLTSDVRANPKTPLNRTEGEKPVFQGIEYTDEDENEHYKSFEIVRSYRYPQKGQEVLISWDVNIPTDGAYIIPRLTIENISEHDFEIDQDDGDIHDGIQVFHDAKMSEAHQAEDSYSFFIPDVTNERVNFDTPVDGTWGQYQSSDQVVITTERDGVGYGVLDGGTNPEMSVVNWDRNQIDYLTGEQVIEPDESIEYIGLVSLHSGGGYDAIYSAEEIYNYLKESWVPLD